MSKTPTASRQPLDLHASGLMLVLCVVLGAQQVAIKAVAPAISPLAQVGLRSLVATALILLVMRQQKIPLWVRGQALSGLLIGLGYTAEFACVAIGLNYTYAAHMSVFLYTAPVFAAVGLHLFVPGERLKLRHWAGVLVAFAGMIIALAPSADVSARILLGDLLGIGGAIAWAATTLTLRLSSMADAPSLRPTAFQLIITTLALLSAAALVGDLNAIHMTVLAWSSLAFQTLAVAFGAVLLWFWLLRRYLAWQLGVFSFLTPIFGVGFGVFLLGEPASGNFVIGSIIILAGLLLVSVHKPHSRKALHAHA